MTLRNVILFLVSVMLLGCNNEKVRNLIDERTDQAAIGMQEAQRPAPPKSYNPLVVTDKVWTGNTSLRMRHGLPLPNRYEGPRGATLVSSDTMSLSEIAQAIGSQTGIPVRIAPGTASGGGGSSGSSSSSGTSASSSSRSVSSTGMHVAYEGPLSGLLDLVVAHFGINWRYDGAAINFSRFETRVFMVEALPGTQTVKDGMKEDSSGGGGSGGSGGGSSGSSTSALSQTSEMSVEFKVWEELGQTVTAMLGGVGNVVTSPSSGTITVTTTPDTMRNVARFIEQENRRLSQQIAINVEIYKVELSEGTDFATSFSIAMKKLGSVATIGGFTHSPSVNEVQGSIVGGANMASLPVAIIDRTFGPISSSFQALSAMGDTTRVAQFPMTTLNNRPVSRRIGRDQTYVQSAAANSATTTTTASGVLTVTITPGTIREGFSLQLTPRLLDDGRIMLQYSMSLVDIVKITTFGSLGSVDPDTGNIEIEPGATAVQLPETASRVFVQQSVLKSGNTLVIGGFDDEQVGQNAKGVGSPWNFLLGGSSSNAKAHSMLVVMITPQVLETPRPEQGG